MSLKIYMCVGRSLKLITVFRKKHDIPLNLWTRLSLDTYPVYVFLECSLIALTLNPVIKCILVWGATCVICFVVSCFILRRVPLLRKVF